MRNDRIESDNIFVFYILEIIISLAAIAVEIMIINSIYFNRLPIDEFVKEKYIYIIVFATLETISWKVLTPKLEHMKENKTTGKERSIVKILSKAAHLLNGIIILISIVSIILFKLQT